MYQLLILLDHRMFLFIHQLPHTVVVDSIVLMLSGALGSMVIVWILLSIWLFVREEKKDIWFFLRVGLASSLSMLITEILLKNIFVRNRPPGAMLSDYSFPSGHATFAWALAVVLASKEPRAKYVFYLLAILISISRIYLGVHYPSDVVAGTLVGVGIGLFSLWVERKTVKKHNKKRRK